MTRSINQSINQLINQSINQSINQLINDDQNPLAVFKQLWSVDWLRTATVYTKLTPGCPRWDWGASDTFILPYTFSLSLQPANRQGQLLSDALTLDWTGLDWALPGRDLKRCAALNNLSCRGACPYSRSTIHLEDVALTSHLPYLEDMCGQL